MAGCSRELDKIQGQFMESCTRGGAGEEVCECTFEKLKEHYGEEGLVAIQSEGRTPPPTSRIKLSVLLRNAEGAKFRATSRASHPVWPTLGMRAASIYQIVPKQGSSCSPAWAW